MRNAQALLALPLALCLLAGCASELSQPAEITLQAKTAFEVLPADVQVVGALNVAAAYAEGLGDAWMDQAELDGELRARFDEFIELTGFNPQEDIREVYGGLSGTGEDHPAANLVVYANFDRDRMMSYLNDKLGDELQTDTYKSTTIFHPAEQEGRDHLYFALVNDEMLVAGSTYDALIGMLDRLDGGGNALDQNADLMRLIGKVARPDGAWLVVKDPFKDGHPGHGDAPIPNISRMVQDVVVSTGFERGGFDVEVQMTTQADVNPEDVADALKGMLAGTRMSNKQNQPLLDTLDRVSIKAHGDGVRVRAFVDEATLADMKSKH